MSRAASAASAERFASPEARTRVPWGAIVLGIPLACGVLALFHFGPWQGTEAQRYVRHPAEWAEVVMFCCAAIAFSGKLGRTWRERRAFRFGVLPEWDGKPVPVAEAGPLLTRLERLPRRFRSTYLVARARAVLDFLRQRGSAEELDDQLRALSDTDAMALEASYSLTRFLIWAIPILGFLGTVLGITAAIAGATPEMLEKNLNHVTEGLALAFDATALGLGLTMITMFLSFIAERTEGSLLERVDSYTELNLAHRFERTAASGELADVVLKDQAQVLMTAMEQMVQRQAEIWARTLAAMELRHAEAEERLGQAVAKVLERALERALETYTRRLGEWERQTIQTQASVMERLAKQAGAVCDAGREQQAAVAKLVQGVSAQAQAMARLQDGEKVLVHLQETLAQNLAALAGANSFDQAMHSLTAAIHLLTTRASAGLASDFEGQRRLPRAA